MHNLASMFMKTCIIYTRERSVHNVALSIAKRTNELPERLPGVYFLFESNFTKFADGYNISFAPIIIRLIVTWYCQQHACVRWGSTLSPKFNVSNSVRQGGILSPLFVNLYMDKLSVTLSKTKIGWALGKTMVSHLA